MKSYIVKVNGVAYNVEVEEAAPGEGAAYQPPPSPAPVKPAVAPPAAAPPPTLPAVQTPKPLAAPASAGETQLTSPLPGTVLKILTSRGQSVKKGEPLLIVEAMKMENEVSAPADGVVASINVNVGSPVNPGDVLLTIS